jgi:hypothetical protein
VVQADVDAEVIGLPSATSAKNGGRCGGVAMLSAGMLQVNGALVGGKVEINLYEIPAVAEAKKLSIMVVGIVHLHRMQNHPPSDDLPINSPKELED